MSATVKAVPDGYHSVTPYLFLRRAAEAIAFYVKAFNARERMRIPGPDGKVMHAEIEIGDSVIMLADEFPQMNAVGPETIGGTSVCIALYVDDVDAIYAQALAAGAKPLRPVQNQFYGDRTGSVTDPFGHNWNIATHVEDVAPDELARRMEAFQKSGGQC